MKVNFPIIKTNRLYLRQFGENDLENVFKGLSHPDIVKYYGVSYDSLEATKEQLIWFETIEKTNTGIWWAVCSFDNETFLGAVGLSGLSQQHKKAEIGFWLLRDFWGQGLIKEVIPIICSYAFKNLNLHRIEGFVETENIACKRTIEKIGFKLEGTMKECEVKNGKFISLDIYAKLKNE